MNLDLSARPHISIITTCKNRLDHLKQSIQFNSIFDNSELIVVDYNCEQGTSSWIKENYPKVITVRVVDDPIFNLSRARNIGARNARGDILCFVDADLIVLLDISDWILNNFSRGNFYTMEERGMGTGGFVICHRDDFNLVGGYDEAFRGWGPEDTDFYERLDFFGIKHNRAIPNQSFRPIQHSHQLRAFGSENQSFSNKIEAFSLGLFFQMVKRDIRNITRSEPEIEFRKQLFDEIIKLNDNARIANSKSFELIVDLGGRALLPTGNNFNTSFIYRYDYNESFGQKSI